MALLLRLRDDLLFGRLPQRPVEREPQAHVQQHGYDHHHRKRAAVDKHHAERNERHHAVKHRLQKTRGQRALQNVNAVKARHHVAQMSLFKPAHR